VFVEPAGGWVGPLTKNAKLTTSDANAQIFGFSVDVSGDTVVAGFPAAVFVKPVGGWAGVLTESAKLNLGFFPVAISGDTVASGVPFLQVYRKPSGGWAGTVTAAATFTASDSGASGGLGLSVALSGTTLVAGALGDDIGGRADQGSAYVFDASTVEAEPAARADCKTTGCGIRVTCNLPPAQGVGCATRVRLLVRANAARLGDGVPAKAKRLIRFAAGARNVPPGTTKIVRLKLTPKGREIVSKTRKKKLTAVAEIRNSIGPVVTTPITIRLR